MQPQIFLLPLCEDLGIWFINVLFMISEFLNICKVRALKLGQTRKVAHDLNLAVTVKTNERGQSVLITARYLAVCTQEQVRGINSRDAGC
jgi:hypothetical protein